MNSVNNSNIIKPLIKIILFLSIFISLQMLYEKVDGIWFKYLIVDEVTAKTATYLINLFTPEISVKAIGNQLIADNVHLNILNGCNGLEVMFLFIPAMIITPLTLRSKLLGLLIGVPYIYLLNQARLMALFYSFRVNQSLFWSLHNTIAPILLIALTVLFLGYWLSRNQKEFHSI